MHGWLLLKDKRDDIEKITFPERCQTPKGRQLPTLRAPGSACDCRFASEAAHKAGRFDLFYSTSLHLATLRARFVLLHYFFHSSSIERGLPRVSVLNQVWWREPVSRSLTHAGPTTAVV